MQADEAGKHVKSEGEEDAINLRSFRSSTSFKYMRKYNKGRAEALSCAAALEESFGVDAGTGGNTEAGTAPAAVHPPLPREPPPASPPETLVTPKQEVEEFEYAEVSAEEEGKERVMCRQFARGACTRGASCIFAHEIILSQLPGIYTFCRDFQNTTCSFPRCKFVHASVFEKEYFYRTGYLPPHVFKHLKESTTPVMAPPPPPPPLPPPPPPPPPVVPHHPMQETGHIEMPLSFPNPPPAHYLHTEVMPTGSVAAEPYAYADPSYKREYRNMDDLTLLAMSARPEPPAQAAPAAPPAPVAPPAPPAPPGCDNCNIVEFRRQLQRNKAEKLRRSIQELEKKTALLSKKNAKQLAVLLALFNQSSAVKQTSNFFSSPNIRNDKEKAVRDTLNVIFSSGGHSSMIEDSNKGLTAVLRLLMSAEEGGAGLSPGS